MMLKISWKSFEAFMITSKAFYHAIFYTFEWNKHICSIIYALIVILQRMEPIEKCIFLWKQYCRGSGKGNHEVFYKPIILATFGNDSGSCFPCSDQLLAFGHPFGIATVWQQTREAAGFDAWIQKRSDTSFSALCVFGTFHVPKLPL